MMAVGYYLMALIKFISTNMAATMYLGPAKIYHCKYISSITRLLLSHSFSVNPEKRISTKKMEVRDTFSIKPS